MTEKDVSNKVNYNWVPILSLLLALVSVLATSYNQYQTSKSNFDIKRFEITYIEKRKAYSEFMARLDTYLLLSAPGKDESFVKTGLEIEKGYYLLQPFLPESDRVKINNRFREIMKIIHNIHGNLRGKNNIPPTEAYAMVAMSTEVQKHKELLGAALLKSLFQ